MKIVGAKLLEKREKAGKTRSDTAKVIGVTHIRLWQIETGKPDGHLVSNLNDNAVNAVCKFLKIKPADIMEAP